MAIAITQFAHRDGDADDTFGGGGHPVGDGVVLLVNPTLGKQLFEPLAACLCRSVQNDTGCRSVQSENKIPVNN